MVLNKTDEIGRSTEQLKESLDLKVQQAQLKLDGVSKKMDDPVISESFYIDNAPLPAVKRNVSA